MLTRIVPGKGRFMLRYPAIKGCSQNVCQRNVMVLQFSDRGRFVLRYPAMEGCSRNVCLRNVMVSQFGDEDCAG